MSKIGIIGGSGLDDPDILERPSEVSIQTPYGDPSSNIKEGKIGGQNVAILSRHGVDHSISPSNVNFRANIWALKKNRLHACSCFNCCWFTQKSY